MRLASQVRRNHAVEDVIDVARIPVCRVLDIDPYGERLIELLVDDRELNIRFRAGQLSEKLLNLGFRAFAESGEQRDQKAPALLERQRALNMDADELFP